jgi:hypothetical protein
MLAHEPLIRPRAKNSMRIFDKASFIDCLKRAGIDHKQASDLAWEMDEAINEALRARA